MENNSLSPNQQPLTPQSSHHFSKEFLIILVILFMAAVGIGGYILGANQNKIVQNQPQPATTMSQPSPTPVNETANWKTYINTKVGFQIKYPARYSKPELPRGLASAPAIYADGTEDNDDIIFGEISTDSFSIVVFPFKDSIQELLKSSEAKGRPPYNWIPSDNILLTSKDVMIDGINAKWLTASYKMGVKDTYSAIFLTKGGYGFIMNPSPNHDEKEIDQILSTFRFVN